MNTHAVIVGVLLLAGCVSAQPQSIHPDVMNTLVRFDHLAAVNGAKHKCLGDRALSEAEKWRCILRVDPSDTAAQTLLLQAEKHEQERDVKFAEIDRRCATKPTRIGMTEKQILTSCWGVPEHVSSTAAAGHRLDQWVYPGVGFLYFRDGVVVAKQDGDT